MTETTPRLEPQTSGGASQASIADLLSGILNDAQTLIKQQAAMLRAEIREDFRRTGDVARYMSAGAALAVVGALFFLVSLVHLLHYLVPAIPMWGSWAIFGGLFLVAGAVAIYAGKRILDSYNPLPDKTLNALEENLTWKTTNRQS